MSAGNKITNPIPGHDPIWETGECTGCETAACGGHDDFLICDNCGEDYPCSTVLSVITELEQQASDAEKRGETAHELAQASTLSVNVHKYFGERAAEFAAAERLRARVAELQGESR